MVSDSGEGRGRCGSGRYGGRECGHSVGVGRARVGDAWEWQLRGGGHSPGSVGREV